MEDLPVMKITTSMLSYDNFANYFSVDIREIQSYNALFEPLQPSGERIIVLSEKTALYIAFKYNSDYNKDGAWGYGVDVPFMTKNKRPGWVKPGSWKAGLTLLITDDRNVLDNPPAHLVQEIQRRQIAFRKQFINTGD